MKDGIIDHAGDELWCDIHHANASATPGSSKKGTFSTDIAAKTNVAKYEKTFEELVPPEYREHAKVFSDQESQRLPQHKPWDHAIDLKPGAPEFLKGGIYRLSPQEQVALDAFLEEHLQKGYIVPSKSPMASPFFFVKKKDGKLRPVQDYRKLNEITIPNRYPLPLADDIVNRLRDAKVFTKFDVRWGYNNIRIKEGDEWKAAFITNRVLFLCRVISSSLTYSPARFHSHIHVLFGDLIAAGKVAVYLDDILIFSKTLEEHRKVTHEVLQRLKDNDLYLRCRGIGFILPFFCLFRIFSRIYYA